MINVNLGCKFRINLFPRDMKPSKVSKLRKIILVRNHAEYINA